MKKLIQISLLIIVSASCNTFKYTTYQYDEAMNAFYKGRHISEIQSKIPYLLVGEFSDGQDGIVYKYDLSVSYKTPSRTTTYTNATVSNNYNNLTLYSSQQKTTYPSQTVTKKQYLSFFTDKSGIVYKVDYLLSPKFLNMTYESYRKQIDY